MSGTPVRPASTQEKIHRQKTKEGDTQAGYLQEKLVGSEFVTIVEEDGSVGKRLKIELNMTGVAGGSFEDPFTGSTSKVPYSSAIRKLLQALYITDATNCGSGGKALIHKVKDIPLGSCSFVENSSTPTFDEDGYPNLSEVALSPVLWQTVGNHGRKPLNSLDVYSINEEGEQGNKEYVAVIANFSIDEDINLIKDSVINVDVMFYCPPVSNSSAFVQCQAVLWSETDPGAQYRPQSSIKEVVYDAVNSVVRRATFEINLSSGSPTAPDGKWLYGALIFTCKADADVKNALINGIRVRYATETIGLRIVDIQP